MNTEQTLILTGEGYNLSITPEAEKRKAAIIDAAQCVTTVTSNDESEAASFHVRRLAELRIEVEKSRKLVKEPVVRIGKLIDTTAKEFLETVEHEEKRLKHAIGTHAADVERERRAKEEAERKAFEAARAAREAAEVTGDESIADEALADRLAASSDLAATKVARGVSFTWDFEVENVTELYRAAPEFVEMTVKRSSVLAWLRELADADDDVAGKAAMCGISAFKRAKVSTR